MNPIFKNLLCAGLAVVVYLPAAARAQLYRPIVETNEISAMNPWDRPIWWKQGESLQYDVYARAGGRAFNLTGTAVYPVWVVCDYTNRAVWRMATTGTVINATNGHVRCTVQPSAANLAATQYWSEVRVYDVDASTNVWIATIADKLAAVYESAQAGDFPPLDPIEFPVTYNVTVHSYGGGTIETDPVWSATATGYWTRTQADGRYALTGHFHSVYATGTPVYAESDPIWSAASNSYLRLAGGTMAGQLNITDINVPSGQTGYLMYNSQEQLSIALRQLINDWAVSSLNVTQLYPWGGAVGITLGGVFRDSWPTGGGNIVATNTPVGAGQMLYAGTMSNTNAYWGPAPTGGGGGMDPAIASNSFVAKTGDAMTGPLDMAVVAYYGSNPRQTGITIRCVNADGYRPISIGNEITNNYGGVAVGHGSKSEGSGTIALGNNAKARADASCALGNAANAGGWSAALGHNANARDKNCVAVGNAAKTSYGDSDTIGEGIAIGSTAQSWYKGHALGYAAKASGLGVGIGHSANATAWVGGGFNATSKCIAIGYAASTYQGTAGQGNRNMAIGADAQCNTGNYRIAIGSQITTPPQDGSCAIRGDLYLDGATTLVFRSTFGAGDWNVGLQTESGRLYSINSAGTRTLISPHDPDTGESILLSENPYAGERVTINLERMAAALEAMGATGLIERVVISRRDWDAEQAQRAAASLADIAVWDKARADAIKAADAWDARAEHQTTPRPHVPDLAGRPEEYTPRPCPSWIKVKNEKDHGRSAH